MTLLCIFKIIFFFTFPISSWFIISAFGANKRVVNAWFPALRFRSSVQIGSSSIVFRIRSRHGTATATREGTTVRTRITETVTESDTDKRNRNAGNRA